MKKLIIFDCDGVLVDSEVLSVEVIVELLYEQEHVVDKKEIDLYFNGEKLDVIFNKIEKNYSVTLPPFDSDEFKGRLNHKFQTSLKPINGIHKTLEQLSVPICVASSSPVKRIKSMLEKTGLLKYFGENLYSSYEIQSWKSEPDIFLHAAEKMNALPSECIIIEDSPTGVEAAVRANMKVFGYSERSDSSELEVKGATSFSKMSELPALISACL